MSEWSSRPKATPRTGHLKATHRWCAPCQALHRTHRHAQGEERCAAAEAAREVRRAAHSAGPSIAKPKAPRQKIRMRVGGVIEA